MNAEVGDDEPLPRPPRPSCRRTPSRPGSPRNRSACAGAARPPRPACSSPKPDPAACASVYVVEGRCLTLRRERTAYLSSPFSLPLECIARFWHVVHQGLMFVGANTGYFGHGSQPVHPRKVIGFGATIRVRVHRADFENVGTTPGCSSRAGTGSSPTANGRVEEVKGEGVVGKKPKLEPGEQFEYTSWSDATYGRSARCAAATDGAAGRADASMRRSPSSR